jgi:ribosome biogenesis protein MAK21
VPAGEARGRSLLGKDEPTIWYEAAAGLPRLDPGGQPPLDESASEGLRQKAEGLVEREAAAFEKEMAGRNAADARWLTQVTWQQHHWPQSTNCHSMS